MESKARIIRPDKEEEKTFTQKLSDFIGKHRVVFISIGAAIVAVLLTAGIYTWVSSSRAMNSARAVELARDQIAAWSEETDEAKKTELETKLLADLDAVAKKYSRTFAAQQALFTKASLYAFKKDWANAETASLAAADRMPKTYLAPVALQAAAVAAEEQGKPDEAIAYYGRIVKDHAVDTPNLAHAYFSLGRLAEGKSDWQGALGHYNKLLTDFSGSDWASLAKNRVVFLKAQGYDK